MTTALAAPAPAVGWASGPLGAVQAADREIARQTAVRAQAVAAFAASRPAAVDRPVGSPGAMSADRWAARPEVLRPVSEWATQELAVALSLSTEAAQALLERSVTLVHRLPATLDALQAGALHLGHLWPLLDKVAPVTDDAVRAGLERDLLTWACRRGTVCTPAQLADKTRREVLRRTVRSAADDLTRAIRRRGVSVRPDHCDGTAVVSALLTTPEAAALVRALGAYADALPDDGRTRGQKTADCLLDLVLRPGVHGLPPGRPGAPLDRHVRARDRRCRFPGCRRPVPRSGELDHTVPWPAGPTTAANLAGFCTGHHRGKHQAPGWRHHLHDDGTLTVTTPTGLVATTTPPPY